MFPRSLFLGGGALALVLVLASPGQLRARPGAQMMRGGVPIRTLPSVRGFTPGFRGFTSGFRGFTPGFRGGFSPRFSNGFNRSFNRGFDARFNRFNGGFGSMRFTNPRFSPGFRPGSMMQPSFAPMPMPMPRPTQRLQP